MSTHDRGPEGHHQDEPFLIGDGLEEVERRLRTALLDDAASVRPNERLDAILAQAHGRAGDSSGSVRRSRWLAPAAAAAAVATIAGGIWVASRPAGQPVVPGLVTSSTSQPTSATDEGTPAPSSSTSTAPTGSEPRPGATASTAVSLPVYYVGPRAAGSARLGLFREFVPVRLDPGEKALAAVRRAMQPPSASGYLDLWRAQRPIAVEVGAATITVSLPGPADAQSEAEAKLAVQQLVWTVQAAVGRGNLPVTFRVGGSDEIAPGFPTSRTYVRPTGDMAVYDVLAPLWIDNPSRGQRLEAGRPVTVSGQASTFEANVEWQLLRGGRELASGYTTASAGAPRRGAFSFRTPALRAGDYVVRILEHSMKDGSVSAEQRIPFSVS